MSTGSKTRILTAVVCGLAGFCAPVAQAQVKYGLTAGYGHSDNVFRVGEGGEISSDILTAGVELDWQEDRTRIDADVRADIDFNHYLNVDENFDVDNQVTGNASGQVTLGIVPEHFTWLIEDSFGQTQQDPLVPATPETLESVNYLTTGPDFTLLIGSTSLLRFSGRYSLTTYEQSPFDSARVGGGITFLRNLSERSTLSLNLDSDDVDYDDPVSIDFLRNSASFTYTLDAARTNISAQLGYTQMDLDDGSENTGPLVDIEVRRKISNSSSLNFRVGTQLSDSAEALRESLESEDFGGDPSGVIATASTFEDQFASVAWEFVRPRTSFDVSVSWDDQVYDNVEDFDRQRMVYEAGAERHLNNRLSARLRISYDVENFEADDDEAKEWRFMLGASYSFGRDTGLELWGERLKRDSTALSGGGHSIENRVFLTFFYRPAAR